MRVKNIEGNHGPVKNQFIIEEEGRGANGNFTKRTTFQSYDSVIAIKTRWPDGRVDIVLDESAWGYSVTTGRYRNIFLGESKAETQRKIDSGEYKLDNLNK